MNYELPSPIGVSLFFMHWNSGENVYQIWKLPSPCGVFILFIIIPISVTSIGARALLPSPNGVFVLFIELDGQIETIKAEEKLPSPFWVFLLFTVKWSQCQKINQSRMCYRPLMGFSFFSYIKTRKIIVRCLTRLPSPNGVFLLFTLMEKMVR